MQAFSSLVNQMINPNFAGEILKKKIGRRSHLSEEAKQKLCGKERGRKARSPEAYKKEAKKVWAEINRLRKTEKFDIDVAEKMGRSRSFVGCFMRRWDKIAKQEGWGG